MEYLHDRLYDVSTPTNGEDAVVSGVARIAQIQGRIVGRLRRAADKLTNHSEGTRSPGNTLNLGDLTGSWLHGTADYIERIEPEKIPEDITEQVRSHPGKSLLVAGLAGFVLSSILRRR